MDAGLRLNSLQKWSACPPLTTTSTTLVCFVPTSEAPYYEIKIEGITGGRNLLSEEVQMLENVALLCARRIDAIRVVNERLALELREQEYSKLATEAKLTALRSQINPHFLFNALNTVGYLIRTAPDNGFQHVDEVNETTSKRIAFRCRVSRA